jgi:exopolysaccharide biosynthesis WecB/TagA/CpsF family protein
MPDCNHATVAPLAPPRWRLGSVEIAALTRQEAIARLLDAMTRDEPLKVAFANAHLVNVAAADAAFSRVLRGFLVLPDGIGVDLGARLIAGRPFPANLNGTDLMPALLAAASRPLRVALIGGKPGVAERAAERLGALFPQHAVTALGHGFLDPAGEEAMLAMLEAQRPDLLLVAMGNPLQERWIARHVSGRHARVAVGVGALFDFLAGEVPRAPAIVRRLRLEWLFRLAIEPRRLWRRYVLGNPLFLWRVLRQKWSA